MKTKKVSVVVLLTMLMLLAASIACSGVNSLPFIATPTSTSTSTPTPTLIPTSTSTPSFTPTATPLPDYSGVVLKLEDLPAGFQNIPNAITHPDTQEVFAFVNTKDFQVLSGVSMLIANQSEQIGFDTMMNNPDMMMQAVAAGAKSSDFNNMKDIPSMDKFGDASKGFTADVKINSINMHADFFIVKKGVVGTFVMILYRPGKIPSITIQEIAKILSERLDKIQ